jgi:hypothetical protein
MMDFDLPLRALSEIYVMASGDDRDDLQVATYATCVAYIADKKSGKFFEPASCH